FLFLVNAARYASGGSRQNVPGKQPLGCALSRYGGGLQGLHRVGVPGQLDSLILGAELAKTAPGPIEADRVELLAPSPEFGELDVVGRAGQNFVEPGENDVTDVVVVVAPVLGAPRIKYGQ